MHRVTLIQRVLPHYRISFVKALRERLWAHNIELELIYGQERAGTVPRTVPLNETWARRVPNVYTTFGGVELVWQRCLGALGRSDLIIVEQSNRLIVNYLLQLQRLWTARRLAFWGHGRNFQSRSARTLRERMKQWLLRHVDWWFAYTDLTRAVLADCKYPESRVTVVNNAIDDAGLHRAMQSLAGQDSRSIAASLGCSGEQVALFCGGLYQDKRLDFLLQAAHLIKATVPDFELLVVGDGPDRHIVERAAAEHPWIKYAGAKTGPEVAPYLAAAQVLLMPGLVGLVLLDSFIAGCPLVTTEFAHHSPEIAYLQPGVNGVVTRDDVHAYAAGVIGCLQDRMQLESLREGCRESARRYSMSAMVENFAAGIERCLARS